MKKYYLLFTYDFNKLINWTFLVRRTSIENQFSKMYLIYILCGTVGHQKRFAPHK